MHKTAISMLKDMVNLWAVWHKMSDAQLVAKIGTWSNMGYSHEECVAAKVVVLAQISTR